MNWRENVDGLHQAVPNSSTKVKNNDLCLHEYWPVEGVWHRPGPTFLASLVISRIDTPVFIGVEKVDILSKHVVLCWGHVNITKTLKTTSGQLKPDDNINSTALSPENALFAEIPSSGLFFLYLILGILHVENCNSNCSLAFSSWIWLSSPCIWRRWTPMRRIC